MNAALHPLRRWLMGIPVLLSVLPLGATSLLSAAEPVRLYLANDDHADYMWTADADPYGRVFVELDGAAALPATFVRQQLQTYRLLPK